MQVRGSLLTPSNNMQTRGTDEQQYAVEGQPSNEQQYADEGS